jgi:ribosomal protein L11 methylase PrmA
MLSRYLKPGGIILLSGLLTEQQAGVLDAYDLVGFQEFYTQEPWLCLEGVKLSQ